jgi:hypothetical protein
LVEDDDGAWGIRCCALRFEEDVCPVREQQLLYIVIVVAAVLCQPVEQGTPVLRGFPAWFVGRAANFERELRLLLPFAVADNEAKERCLQLELSVLVLIEQSVVIVN